MAARAPVASPGGATVADTQPVKLLRLGPGLRPTAAAAEGCFISHPTGIWVTGVSSVLGDLRLLHIFTILFSFSFHLLSVACSSLTSKSSKFPLTFSLMSCVALSPSFCPSSATPLPASVKLPFIAQAS